jgi:hypothetical protein
MAVACGEVIGPMPPEIGEGSLGLEMKCGWAKYENLSVDETDLRLFKPWHSYG